MKTVCTKLYEIGELSDDGKEKAIDNNRYVNVDDNFWYDAEYDDFDTVAMLLGVTIDRRPVPLHNGKTTYEPAIYFSGFSSQGDGACFEGKYAYKRHSAMAIKRYAPVDNELHRIANELQAIQKKHGYKLTATIEHSGRYSHKYSTTIQVMKNDDYVSEDVEKEISELLRDFMEWMYRQLEKQYDYLTSDEAIIETLEANEFWFTENGNTH